MKISLFTVFNVAILGLAGCTVNPDYSLTIQSNVQWIKQRPITIPIHEFGYKGLLKNRDGCLSLLGMPLVLMPTYSLRMKNGNHYLYKKQRPIAKVGDKIEMNGMKIKNINDIAQKIHPSCISEEYLLVSDLEKY